MVDDPFVPGRQFPRVDALQAVLDVDSDGVHDDVDNCPTIANGGQEDGELVGGVVVGDGVGDACDNCVDFVNPRRAGTYLTDNPWATLTGGQRDDDADGYGNRCDADFNNSNFVIGGPDLTHLSDSIPRLQSEDTCGTPEPGETLGTIPCAVFDLSENEGPLARISGPDITLYSQQAGTLHSASKRCPTCPLECTAGTGGNCP